MRELVYIGLDEWCINGEACISVTCCAGWLQTIYSYGMRIQCLSEVLIAEADPCEQGRTSAKP